MKAMILAAGRGTRMRHLTEAMPKPMIPVAGKPILQRILEGLHNQAGIQDFFILTGYKEEAIRGHFGDGSAMGWKVTYATQTSLDGTGSAVGYSKEWVGAEPFFVLNGDILVRPEEYAGVLATFTQDGVVTVKEVDDVSQGGACIFDQDFVFQSVLEKGKAGSIPSRWFNAGIYGFTPAVFEYIARLEKSPRGEYELTDALNAMAQNGLKLNGYALKTEWVDVRDPEVLAEVEQSGLW